MHDIYFLADAVVIFGTALIAAWLFRFLRAPSIIGFLFTGLIIGPSGLSLIAQEEVEPIAELGLVSLLFTIGLELSPKPLIRMGRSLAMVSALQVGLTAGLGFLVILIATAWNFSSGMIVAFAVALSSTAIVLTQLSERGETDTLDGMVITGVLLVQDVLVISMMVFLPLLTVGSSESWQESLMPMIWGLGGLVVVVVVARRALPWFLDNVIRPGGREFGTLFAVLMAIGGAWAAGLAGWSLPLGACIAGLLLADADERHQIAADILPFRDVFNALFFISLGMLVNVEVVVAHGPFLVLAVAATLAVKTAITAGAVMAARWPLRTALRVGLGLCTVSEFGYVLAREAEHLGVIESGILELLVVYSLGAMAAGAVLMPLSHPITNFVVAKLGLESQSDAEPLDEKSESLSSHIIIVGFGVNGANLARVLSATRIPFIVIEMNPRLAQAARSQDAEVILGDASRMAILEHAGLSRAYAIVVAINDPAAIARIVARARDARPDLYILARTRFVAEIDHIYQLGADLVIPEEFETSLEIAAHVLKQMNVPDNVIEGQLAAVRAGGYGMLRGMPTTRATAAELMKVFQLTVTRSHYLEADSYPVGKTLMELNLRALTGTTIIAVVRSGKPITNPPSDFKLDRADVLVLVGSHAQLDAAKGLLEQGVVPERHSSRSDA